MLFLRGLSLLHVGVVIFRISIAVLLSRLLSAVLNLPLQVIVCDRALGDGHDVGIVLEELSLLRVGVKRLAQLL